MADILVDVVVKRTGDGRVADLGPRVDFPAEFRKRAPELGESIGEVANLLRDALEKRIQEKEPSAWALHGIELKFSMDLEAEAGVVITRAKASAGFDVTLSWARS